MRAVARATYGGPEVLELREVEKPEPAGDEVLVRIRAASVNRAEWYELTGRPYIARPTTGLRAPKSERLGVDFAGTVEAVGKDVTTGPATRSSAAGTARSRSTSACARSGRLCRSLRT